MELKPGQYVALTKSIKSHFIDWGHTEKQVNSVIQIEEVYPHMNCIKLNRFVSPVKYEEVISLRFVDTEMTASYNVAMNTFYNKLCNHKPKLENLISVSRSWSLYDNACGLNSLVKTLADETEEELNYELSERQCSIAVRYFIHDKLKK